MKEWYQMVKLNTLNKREHAYVIIAISIGILIWICSIIWGILAYVR